MVSKKWVCEYLFLFVVAVAVAYAAPSVDGADDYEDSTEGVRVQSCDADNCRLPECSCFGSNPQIPIEVRPQFVMLTFDDAVTVANIATYRKIVKKSRQHMNGKGGIRLTFFVCHEYNDYTLTNDMYSKGHEIAVHSVSHESNTDLWRRATEDKWKKEMVGARTMLNAFSGIPADEMVGHRAPFLQTSGDSTFRMLKKEGFLYDSSMSSRTYRDPPIWPYTLDHGYRQDCQIQPCPSEKFEGLWVVPMIQYNRTSKEGAFFCSMVDACTPQPLTAADTKAFLMNNFNRHYQSNKAPFPVFLHEAWLRDEERLRGYLQFLDEILLKPDVFVVSVRDVVEYMRNPVDAVVYTPRAHQSPTPCKQKEVCTYKQPLRNMQSCSPCPPYYPWVGTPLGKRSPKEFPGM